MDDPVQRFRDFLEYFANEPDRSAAILVPAKLDALLLICVQRRLLPPLKATDDPLLNSDRAIGTFSSRIEIAYRLGMLDADFARSLHLLRKIRNEFAHCFDEQYFSSPQHKSRIDELAKPISDTQYFRDTMNIVTSSNDEMRSKYIVVSGMMSGGLELYSTVVPMIGTKPFPPLQFNPETFDPNMG